MKILMVDDDEDDIYAVRRGIISSINDVKFSSVSSAEALFAYLEDTAETLPNLMLLDINMPRQNGFEILSQLKSTEKWAKIPVMMLSTSSHDADRVKAEQLGAVSFSTKFSSMKDLECWLDDVKTFLQARHGHSLVDRSDAS